jgi:hypothetical protein
MMSRWSKDVVGQTIHRTPGSPPHAVLQPLFGPPLFGYPCVMPFPESSTKSSFLQPQGSHFGHPDTEQFGNTRDLAWAVVTLLARHEPGLRPCADALGAFDA